MQTMWADWTLVLRNVGILHVLPRTTPTLEQGSSEEHDAAVLVTGVAVSIALVVLIMCGLWCCKVCYSHWNRCTRMGAERRRLETLRGPPSAADTKLPTATQAPDADTSPGTSTDTDADADADIDTDADTHEPGQAQHASNASRSSGGCHWVLRAMFVVIVAVCVRAVLPMLLGDGFGEDDVIVGEDVATHSHTKNHEVVVDQWHAISEEWSVYACIRKSTDVEPTWLVMETSALGAGGEDVAYPEAGAAERDGATPPGVRVDAAAVDGDVLRTWEATTTTNIRLLQPTWRRHSMTWHVDRMTIYMFVSHDFRSWRMMERQHFVHHDVARQHHHIDIVARNNIGRVWNVANMLHAALHHLPGATAEATKNVALWVPPAMNNTMRVYNFACRDEVLGIMTSVCVPAMHTGEVGPSGQTFVDTNTRDVDAQCALACAGDAAAEHSECNRMVSEQVQVVCECGVQRCVKEGLTAHNDIECTLQTHVPHHVWQRLVEA